MNSFAVVISAMLALAAAETVIQKNHPNGAWEVRLTSDGNQNQFYQQPIAFQQQPQRPTFPATPTRYQHIPIVSQSGRQPIPIVSQSEIHHPDGGYQMAYQSADGQSFSEQGKLRRNFENDGNVVVKSGQYAYTAPDGTPIALSWVADENGFKATGAHLPKAPAAL
uniref:Endocuticle structural glycoprotein SgAbd-2 n=1 Tax=Cacopsylla melanoneura TaxID=428564 RepID=A0A8D8RPP3_9HEMI